MKRTRKVLFVSNLSHSRHSLQEIWKEKNDRNITELYGSSGFPLGILSIQSYITKYCENVETRIVDLNVEFLKKVRQGNIEQELEKYIECFEKSIMSELQDELMQFQPDIVAISSLFDKNISTLLILAAEIKKVFPNTIIIAGGHPVTNLYEYILINAQGTIDAISYGEGEIPFKELLSSDDLREHLTVSPYFITVEKLQSGFEKKYAYVENLDDIPMYDYETYLSKYGDEVLSYHNNVLDTEHSFNRQAVLMTSRGCPYNCIFCASHAVHGKKMRENSIERVKQELDYWIDKKHVETIGFIDDHFLYDVDRAIELCDYVGSKGVDIRFPSGLAIAPITKELVQCMVRNNVREVQLALESGSERVLKEIIKKPLSLEIADRVFGYFKETDIFVKCFLVIGFPDETEQDIEDGLRYLRQADFSWCSISNPTPISGSRLLKETLEKGILKEYDFDNVSFFKPSYANQERYNGDLRYTINLDINFVHNALMRMGKYEEAEQRFKSVIMNYPDHAFAWFYLAKCLKLTGRDETFAYSKYQEIIERDEQWRKYSEYFGLL